MDKREYLRVVQVGTCRELIWALQFYTDYPLNFKKLDHKIIARAATKMTQRHRDKPKFFFSPKFFTKLSFMPAVSIEVMESRSHIRKTCYGFRDHRSGERVYMRIDPGSVVEFRDSISGVITGTRYIIPGIDRMKGARWDKVARKVSRLLVAEGIIVTREHVAKYLRTFKPRAKLTARLVALRSRSLKWKHRIYNEKAYRKIS